MLWVGPKLDESLYRFESLTGFRPPVEKVMALYEARG
jgi:hypothetical protein